MALGSNAASGTKTRRRVLIRVEGIVQGVGFRPYLYRLAHSLGLAGEVRNDVRGVRVEVEGAPAGVASFLARLGPEAPPLARVERVSVEESTPLGESGFVIVESEAGGAGSGSRQATSGVAADPVSPSAPVSAATALVPQDVATCAACLSELFDPANRRYRYPFINCTDCGPRFTIIRDLPYDRRLTTMAGFTMCAHCRTEYEDPADRRFHAQPNACAECGPRVWVVGGDEEAGPGAGGAILDPIRVVAAALRAGAIVALKGLGGFHLACLARDAVAVCTLRERKRRPAKPFALMVPDLAAARRLVHLDAAEEALLRSRERPIVLARWRRSAVATRDGAPDLASGGDPADISGPGSAAPSATTLAGVPLAASGISADTISEVTAEVAPGQRELGVMLPYTPLHHLLLAELGEPLVMTSGNRSDEPIAFRNEDALARLAGIADLFLLHDRPIQVPVDDSVARVVTLGTERRVQLIRRARGYAPLPLTLPFPARRPVLACGAELKNSFCLARGERAWLSQHIGDLEDYETLRAFSDGVAHLEALSGIGPEVVAHDLHPEYRSTRYALERVARGGREERRAGLSESSATLDDAVPTPHAVQHHHAHLAACLAEHGETGPALGVIFDGTGYGPDGTIWGGEFLVGDLVDYERVGHLYPVRLPGGEAAIREPWRMACAWLVTAQELATGCAPPIPATLAGRVTPTRWAAVARLAITGLASPVTTSMGRLFDAVGALCGLCTHASYEGEAAIALEAAIEPGEMGGYELPILANDPGTLILDPRPLIRSIATDLEGGTPVGVVAARYHNTLVRATVSACMRLAARHGVGVVALSGGVFQNRGLLEGVAADLARMGLRVLVPGSVPPNDGGISLGQAAIAAARSIAPVAPAVLAAGLPAVAGAVRRP